MFNSSSSIADPTANRTADPAAELTADPIADPTADPTADFNSWSQHLIPTADPNSWSIQQLINSTADRFNSWSIQQLIDSTADWFNSWLILQLIDSAADWFNSWLIQQRIQRLIDSTCNSWLIQQLIPTAVLNSRFKYLTPADCIPFSLILATWRRWRAWLVRAAVGRGRTPTLTPGHDPAPLGHAQDPGSSAGTPGINILLQIHPASSTTYP